MTSSDQTKNPSAAERRQAREQGHVAHSHDLAAAAALAGCTAVLFIAYPHIMDGLASLMRSSFKNAAQPEDLSRPWHGHRQLGVTLIVVAGACWLLMIVSRMAQVGWHFLPSLAAPRIGRASPALGFQRLLSAGIAMQLLLGIAKVACVAGAGWIFFWAHFPAIMELPSRSVRQLVPLSFDLLLTLLGFVLAGMLLVGAADYAWKRAHHERSLRRMRKDERRNIRAISCDPDRHA